MGEFEILGTRLKQLRSQLNMSQAEFAEYIGISASTLSAYEIGAKNPSIGIFKIIAEKCNVSIDWLCGLSENRNINNRIENYADIYKMLFDISMAIDINFSSHEENITIYGNDFNAIPHIEPREITTLYFDDEKLITFISEWQKMHNLHKSKIIDDDVYNLWKEKVILKATQDPTINIIDDNLPFV